MTRVRSLALVVWLVAALGGLPGFSPVARADQRTVTVAVHDLTPFVMTHVNIKTGFTVDVLDQIAKRAGWNITYLDVPTVSDQLKAVAEGRADAAAGAISITASREKEFDFSQPILDGGLRIMVPANSQQPSTPGLIGFLKLLFSKMVLIWLAAAVAISLIPAHITWLLERRHHDSMVAKAYYPGVLQAFRWNLGAVAGAADDSPRQPAARLMAVLWGFVSIIFIAYYTATLTANITVGKLDSQIKSPSDLVGKQVCTVANTTSAAALTGLKVVFDGATSIDDCYKGLKDGKYQAVVYDAPVLSYYVTQEGRGSAVLAGAVFEPQGYGIVFRNNNELREEVDRALLAMREDGDHAMIKQKWFGTAT